MALIKLNAGDIAPETAYYRCKRCGYKMMVEKGQPLPNCPACNHSELILETSD